MKTDNFKEFWFEGNLYFTFVKSQEDVNKLLTSYDNDLDLILNAKNEAPYVPSLGEVYELPPYPTFGLRREHTGRLTLRKWVEDNNMLDYFIK